MKESNNNKKSAGRNHMVFDGYGFSPFSPLREAIGLEDLELVTELLKTHDPSEKLNSYESTGLHLTTNVQIAKLLLQRGADIEAKDSMGDTPHMSETQRLISLSS